jgi:protein-S-isoprenylcysteine O-methyltransferase Ste14
MIGWRKGATILGALLFLLIAPGTIAGLIPYWLTRWRIEAPLLGVPASRVVGVVMVLAGVASLLDSFARFVFIGLGTPAPVAPPSRLVVSGQYRHVRNPMYVAILTLVLGQGLILGSGALFRYAAFLWVLFHAFVVLYEEPTLRATFGAAYGEYCSNVGRWIPRVRPWRAG